MIYLSAEPDRLEDLRRTVVATAKRYPHLSVRAIGRLLRLWPSEVWPALKEVLLERPYTNAGDKFTAENVRADLAAGLIIEAIARKYDESPDNVQRLLEEPAIPREIPQEVQPVTACALPDPNPESIARLRAANTSWGDISLQLGSPRSAVCRVATESGFGGEPIEAERYLSKTTPAPDTAGQPEPEPQAEAIPSEPQQPARPGKTGHRRRRLTTPPLAEVAKLRARGLSWQRIAGDLGSSTGTVHRMGQDAGIHVSYVHAQVWCDRHGVEWREEAAVEQPALLPVSRAETSMAPAHRIRTLDEIKADLEAEARKPKRSVGDLLDTLQNKAASLEIVGEYEPEPLVLEGTLTVKPNQTPCAARGILPKGLSERAVEPPLIYLNKAAFDGGRAKVMVQSLVGALEPGSRYDVELIVREVPKPAVAEVAQ